MIPCWLWLILALQAFTLACLVFAVVVMLWPRRRVTLASDEWPVWVPSRPYERTAQTMPTNHTNGRSE
ncbi:hypothetical protein [uncultured Microbacterium sp.]|uniref:hypothetical protein n=1 Tax=uncultured Microbacterium sp. TaxID=191216 RepID=UPI0025F5B442|nr:hypothetical protein [uncultured Microbacterium sp.]